jgi:hypothetical protein
VRFHHVVVGETASAIVLHNRISSRFAGCFGVWSSDFSEPRNAADVVDGQAKESLGI